MSSGLFKNDITHKPFPTNREPTNLKQTYILDINESFWH